MPKAHKIGAKTMKIPFKVKIISEEHNGAISFRFLAITK